MGLLTIISKLVYSPEYLELKNRMAKLGSDSGIKKVGSGYHVWHQGTNPYTWPLGLREAKSLYDATCMVADFEDEFIRAEFIRLNPGENELNVYREVNQNGYVKHEYTLDELRDKYIG